MYLTTFQIISDLHLETQQSYDYRFPQTAPNLALLGDIDHVADDALFAFLEDQLRRYWNVFFLLGNHEPVLGGWSAAKQRVREFADRMNGSGLSLPSAGSFFLDQTLYYVNDSLTVLGCTLFSRVTSRTGPSETTVDAHVSDLQWLNAQMSEISRTEPYRQIAIFTHHSSTLDGRAVDERHKDRPVASGFGADLSAGECWTNPAVAMWAFGHTHFSCDFTDEFE